MPPISICLDAAMSYRGSDAFVLRDADGAAGVNGIRALRTALGCALADRGFRPSPKYDPHMTLSYDPRQRAEPVAVEPISFQVAEFALVKSHVGFTRHEVLRTWPLAG
jgi:2'-5' RNA ligase